MTDRKDTVQTFGNISIGQSIRKEMLQTFIGCSIIGILLSGISFVTYGKEAFSWIMDQFLSAYFVGYSIVGLIYLFKPHTIKRLFLRWAAMIVTFTIGGWIGANLTFLVMKFVFMKPVSLSNIVGALPSVTFFSIFFGVMFGGYSVLREKLDESIERLAEKEINEQNLLRLKTKAELEALRSKVNPHFLFNTLNSIASLISVNQEKAEDMVLKLSDLFRYTLDASTRETVKLSWEIDAVKKYLEIEKIRLGQKLTYSVEMDPTAGDIVIPGLILQPLVENSIKHGIAQKRDGGSVTVQCRNVSTECKIEIIDTGKGFDPECASKGFGIAGVRERLELIYKDNYSFLITSNNGVHITILLPLQEGERLL